MQTLTGRRIPLYPARSLVQGLAVVACVSAGCTTEVTGPRTTVWEADLVPILPAVEEALVAVVSSGGRSEVSILMTSGRDGDGYAWNLRSGSCSAEGGIVGGTAVYPTLAPGPSGQAEGETVLSRALDPGDDYAAWLYRVSGDDQRLPVACGKLEPRN